MRRRTLQPKAAKPRRILVVDDEGSHRWVIRRLLETAFGGPVRIDEVSNGADAIRRLATGPPLDLVVLDLDLPGENGLEILRWLRAELRTVRVPIIGVTSTRDEGEERRALELGATAVVAKSDPPEETLQRLRLLPIAEDSIRRSRRSSTSSARP